MTAKFRSTGVRYVLIRKARCFRSPKSRDIVKPFHDN